jgi:hypothetical protein
MDEVIAEDFVEFGRSGRVYRREDTLAVPRRPIDAVLPLPDFRARLLAPGVAQVTYNSAITYDGVVYHARRSFHLVVDRGGMETSLSPGHAAPGRRLTPASGEPTVLGRVKHSKRM